MFSSPRFIFIHWLENSKKIYMIKIVKSNFNENANFLAAWKIQCIHANNFHFYYHTLHRSTLRIWLMKHTVFIEINNEVIESVPRFYSNVKRKDDCFPLLSYWSTNKSVPMEKIYYFLKYTLSKRKDTQLYNRFSFYVTSIIKLPAVTHPPVKVKQSIWYSFTY